MLLYRSLKLSDRLFYDGDIIDGNPDLTVDNKKAIKYSDVYEIITKKLMDEGEVHVEINERDYLSYKLKPEYEKKIMNEESFIIEYSNGSIEVIPLGSDDSWKDEIMKMSADSMMDDMTYMIYKKFLTRSNTYKIHIIIKDKNRGQIDFVDWITGSTVGVKEVNKSFDDVLLYEWLGGYWNTNKLVYKQGDQEVPIEIGKTYKINFEGKQYDLHGMYTPQIRLAMLKGLYTEEQIKKAQETGKLKTLQHWQYDVVRNWGHVNVVAAVRRLGKTFMSSLLAVREILRENFNPKPIRVLYYGLSDKKTKTAIDYLMSVTKEFRKLRMFTRRQAEKTLQFIDPETKDPFGFIEFHSAKEDEAGVGEYADMIIIDEAARFPEYVYDSMKAIVFSEGAKAMIISTIHWDTSKNWFYQLLLKAERETMKTKKSHHEYLERGLSILNKVNEHGYDYFIKNKADIYKELTELIFKYKRYVAWRVTLSEADRMPEYKKKALIEEIKSNPLRYYTEVFCIYPSENKVFNYETGLVSINKDEVLAKKKYSIIYVGYDPAIDADNAAIVSIGVYRDDLGKLRFEIFDTIKIEPNKNITYNQQISLVEDIVGEYKSICSTYLAVDATGVGRKIIEDFKSVDVDFPIRYTSGSTYKRDKGIWNIPKNQMVYTLKILFDDGHVKINKDLTDLLAEIDYFKRIQTEHGNIKYEAEAGHDDLVNAMMISIFSAVELDGLKNELVGKEEEQNKISELTYEQINKMIEASKIEEQKKEVYKKASNYLQKYGY